MAVDEGAVLASLIAFGSQRGFRRDVAPKPEFTCNLVSLNIFKREDSRFSEMGLPNDDLGHQLASRRLTERAFSGQQQR